MTSLRPNTEQWRVIFATFVALLFLQRDRLREPFIGTAFVLVTSPRRDAVEEATFFAERLAEDGRRIETLIVNRVHPAFGGADPAYFTRNSKGVIEAAAADYAGPTAEARRARIMPFVWQTVARDGQIFGDAARQSRVHLTNGLWFSYPGYNELLSGAADPRIDMITLTGDSATGRWLMAAELVETTRLFGRGLANIEPQWLEQVGGHLLKKQLLSSLLIQE